MIGYLFKLELRLLVRERASWAMLVLFAAALFYGLWNGARLDERRVEITAGLGRESRDWMSQLRDFLSRQPLDAQSVASRPSYASMAPPPLPMLAAGQSDLMPDHESISLFKLNDPQSRSELENPSVLLAGRFDLAFVLVWLFPLFLLAFVYDLAAGDRESGTLRLGLAQGITPFKWLNIRVAARAMPIFALAVIATLAAGLFSDAVPVMYRTLFAVGVVFVYALFWIALAVAVNTVARTAASAATALGAAWVLLVQVIPTMLNVAVEAFYPTPSRAELVAAGRKASGDAEKRGGELLNSFYRDHPELAPAHQQADFVAQHLAVQSEMSRAVEPIRARFDEQLARQQAAVAKWRFVSPAIAMYEALTDLAGTGYWRHRAFRDQTTEFKRAMYDFYSPKVHRRELITNADFERIPQFIFREEPGGAWGQRVAAGTGGMAAGAALLLVWTARRLRPGRAGDLVS